MADELPGHLQDGLFQKYRIEKRHGMPVDPDAKYFVLRYDTDPNAVVAVLAYAKELVGENTVFTKDLLTTLFIYAEKHKKLEEWATVAIRALYHLKAEPEALREAQARDEIRKRLDAR